VSDDFSALRRAPIGKTAGPNDVFGPAQQGNYMLRASFESESDTIVLCSRQLPYAPIELTLGIEGVVLGEVDIEIRSIAVVQKPAVSSLAGALPGAQSAFASVTGTQRR